VILRLLVLASALLLAVRISAAAPVELDGRVVLASTNLKEAIEPAVVLHRRDAGAEVRFHVGDAIDVESTSYAVHVKFAEDAEGLNLRANGTRTDMDPFRRGDGHLFRLMPWHLRHGINILEFATEHGTTPLIEELTVFSLVDTFEEVHFERAFFRREDAQVSVQPPTHADQDRYDALHYNIALTVSMVSTHIVGEVTMTARATDAGLTQAVLDFHPNNGAMTVTSVDSGPGTPALPFTVSNTQRRIFISLPEALNVDDQFTVRIAYQGTPSTGGVFGPPYRLSSHGAGIPIIFTFSQPYGARHWWPCKDVPEDKALVDLQITAPLPYVVVSNGKLISTDVLPGSLRRFNYSHGYPVVTYLVSVIATTYLYAERTYTALDGVTTMPVGAYVFPQYPEDLSGVDGTLEIINFLRDKFGEYPFVTEKYVTAAHTITSGMEHQTNSSMAPRALEGGGTGRQQVHELTHMWFGDKVTMNHFNHLWIHEGWATYAEALWQEHKFGRAAYHSYVNAWTINDTDIMVGPAADSFAGTLAYRRGGFVLHMLRRVVGDEAFYEAANKYLQDNAYDVATTEDLQAAYEQVHGEPLDWFFQQWCYRAGRPTYSWNYWITGTPGNRVLNVTIQQTQSGDAYRMPIEIHAVNVNGVRLVRVVENTSKLQTFAIPIGPLEPVAVEFDPDNYVLKNVTALPLTIDSVKARPEGMHISWSGGLFPADNIEIWHSTDTANWTQLSLDGLTPGPNGGVIHDAPAGQDHYYRLVSRNPSNNAIRESTHAYGARRGIGTPRVLVVEGYERWITQGRGTWHPYAAWTGRAVGANGHAWESASNKTVGNTIQLGEYDAVIYVLGEESTAQETFSSAEQEMVKTFLRDGGQLFVTGAEIGWDLDNRGNTGDRDFYNNFLKADYVDDDSGVYTVFGTAGQIFDGLNFAYDDGTHGIYFQEWPDAIAPVNGGVTALRYNHPSYIAGVQYSGLFPGGSTPGKVVYLGFAFETIYPESAQNEVMGRVLNFFDIVVPTVEGEFIAID
jgi:aminopeptidase N